MGNNVMVGARLGGRPAVGCEGIAHGIPIHSYLDTNSLDRLMPLQTGGHWAALIADVCRSIMLTGTEGKEAIDVSQCGDCRSGASRFHTPAG
jgi:hypothetical protein